MNTTLTQTTTRSRNALTTLSVGVIAVLTALFAVLAASPAQAASSVDVDIPVEQTITSSSGNGLGGAFTYTLTPTSAGAPMPTTDTLTLTGNQTGMFGPITHTDAGTYEYMITPTGTPSETTYTVDHHTYTVTVHITHDSNGNLETATIITNAEGAKVPAAAYTHHWGAVPTDPGLMVDPPVKKTITGNPKTQSTFTFTLTALTPSAPMPKGSTGNTKTLQITGNGQAEFGTWSYTTPGTYHYTITEENDHQPGYTYDTSIYTITDTVTETSGVLLLDRVVTNSSARPVTTAAFINTYTPTSNENGNNENGGNSTTLPTTGTGTGTGNGTTLPGLGSPQTGDTTNLTALTITLTASSLIALASLIALIILARRRKGLTQQ